MNNDVSGIFDVYGNLTLTYSNAEGLKFNEEIVEIEDLRPKSGSIISPDMFLLTSTDKNVFIYSKKSK